MGRGVMWWWSGVEVVERCSREEERWKVKSCNIMYMKRINICFTVPWYTGFESLSNRDSSSFVQSDTYILSNCINI